MTIAQIAQSRYATKAFDPQKTIAPDLVAQLEAVLRFSPSSVNSQPWHYVLAETQEGRETVAKAMSGSFSYNEAKVKAASHVVVFCTRVTLDEAYLNTLLAQEEQDGRFATPELKAAQQRGRAFYTGTHRFELRDLTHWMEKQVYLSVGTLLLGAASLGIDACPMEGFDQKILDQQLGLRAMGYTSSVVVALGYRSASDANASLPKSRRPLEAILTRV